MATLLKDIAVGSLVKLNESGVPVEFYVACHDYESGLNGTGRTLLVRKDCHSERLLHNTGTNNYSITDTNTWLNSDYLATLDEFLQSYVGTTTFPWRTTTLTASVFILSTTELGIHTGEGTTLPIASDLKIAYWNGTAVTQWTRSGRTDQYANMFPVSSTGVISSSSSATSTGIFVRPVLTLPNDVVVVTDDGTVGINPVAISGEDENIGKKYKSFSVEYSVTSLKGNGVTVTETLDDEVLRTYSATEGETQTASFEVATLEERMYTFTINATNSDTGEATERTYLFYAVPFTIHDGGTIQEFQDENGDPVFPATLAKAVFTESGKSVERLLSDLVGADSYVWAVYQPLDQLYQINDVVNTFTFNMNADTHPTISIEYADEVDGSAGTVQLVNPTSWSGGVDSGNAAMLNQALTGKFWKLNGDIYYSPTTIDKAVSYSHTNSAYVNYYMSFHGQQVLPVSTTEMSFLGVVFEQDINAYPKDGVQDFRHYVLFGNLIGSIVSETPRIEMGRYTGTGTSSEANPCSITFAHKPKVVWVCANKAITNGEGGVPWVYGASSGYSSGYANGGISSTSYTPALQWDGNTLSWWTSSNAVAQLNSKGEVYNYFALY